MAYDPLDPERFKDLKPQFADVPDTTVQNYIDLAARFVDQSWPEADYEAAWAAATCHLMTLDGLGDDAASRAQANGTAQYQTIKSADLTLTKFAKDASASEFASWWGQTPCGQYYLLLLRMAKAGPRVAMGGHGRGVSPYAKDVPFPPYSYGGPFQKAHK